MAKANFISFDNPRAKATGLFIITLTAVVSSQTIQIWLGFLLFVRKTHNGFMFSLKPHPAKLYPKLPPFSLSSFFPSSLPPIHFAKTLPDSSALLLYFENLLSKPQSKRIIRLPEQTSTTQCQSCTQILAAIGS